MSTPLDPNILTQRLDLGGDGPRVVVKDCLDITGTRTGCGSRAMADCAPAKANAAVVDALVAAGCRIVGKANMHELAYGVTGINAYTGTPLNPKFPDRIVGGSSSGSAAAVALGIADFAIGTDTGGSIRMPAACCGIFGLKPTFGAISRQGAIPSESSLDCIGPFAPDMATIELALQAILPDYVTEDMGKTPVVGRVSAPADADIDAAVDGVLSRAAVAVRACELPSLFAAHEAGITIMAAEMAALFGDLVGSGLLGPDIDARIAAGMKVTSEQVARAEEVRARFTAEVDGALEEFDALALPTMPSVPILVSDAGDAKAALRLTQLVRPFNVSGHPALAMPTLTAKGLPASIQLVGAMNAEPRLCAVGRIMAEAL
ncbi:amidase [Croceicoccus gelatinilyticus]|uniref:amidase n=1 Tax=Croceicoccus gelatinilyticus TaxID=2835536 RepID=UPI001BD082ED|nr:amidase [Croceicoccus gelatinilyticus]MBS7669400.1 amidase [Croceicoccus gelatinilyticus]